jgi:hypothetical protein
LWKNIIEKGPFVGRLDVIALKFGRQVGKQKGTAFFSDSSFSFPDLVSCGDSPPLGLPMLIFLAGLKQIPAEYYEAASIDGAGPLGKFIHITLHPRDNHTCDSIWVEMGLCMGTCPRHLLGVYFFGYLFPAVTCHYTCREWCIPVIGIGTETACSILFSQRQSGTLNCFCSYSFDIPNELGATLHAYRKYSSRRGNLLSDCLFMFDINFSLAECDPIGVLCKTIYRSGDIVDMR